jgi:protein-S-isoprenylcysteine O-methyltransferase Ste14
MLAEFGDEYRRYKNLVPAFIPRLGPPSTASQP